MMRIVCAIVLCGSTLLAQAKVSVQQPLWHRSAPGPVNTFSHPHKVNPHQGAPPPNFGNPHRLQPHTSRILPVARIKLSDAFEFKAPETPTWYKILTEKNQCIQGTFPILAVSFEAVQLKLGGWDQGTCADQGFSKAAQPWRDDIPSQGNIVVDRFDPSLYTLPQVSSVLMATSIAAILGSGVAFRMVRSRFHTSITGVEPLLGSS